MARLIWAAPGSLRPDRLDLAWKRRQDVRDLATVPGPWAAVLWSSARRAHIVATDPMGTLPAYIARTASGVVAGSWLSALVARSDVDSTPDPEGVLLTSSTLLLSDRTAHRTRFASISKVPWGRAVAIGRDGSQSLERYWDPSHIEVDNSLIDPRVCADLLDSALGDVLADHLPDVGTRVGAHVSGGLDCTTIACRIHHLLLERGERIVEGYSWSPTTSDVPTQPFDERRLLDEVETAEGFPIHTRYSDGSADWMASLDPCAYSESTHFAEKFVLPRAAVAGVQVMFSGWGGDELASFNGRAVPHHLIRSGQWLALVRQTRARRAVTRDTVIKGRSVPFSLARQVWHTLPESITRWRQPRQHGLQRRHEVATMDRLAAWSDLAADLYRERLETAAPRDHHSYQLFLLGLGHIQHRCSAWYPTGRLFGVDYRYPLLDRRVVECALSLPWQAFYSQGWDRTAFRHMAARHVPASVAWNVAKYEPANFFNHSRSRADHSAAKSSPKHPDSGVTAALEVSRDLRWRVQPRNAFVGRSRATDQT